MVAATICFPILKTLQKFLLYPFAGYTGRTARLDPKKMLFSSYHRYVNNTILLALIIEAILVKWPHEPEEEDEVAVKKNEVVGIIEEEDEKRKTMCKVSLI